MQKLADDKPTKPTDRPLRLRIGHFTKQLQPLLAHKTSNDIKQLADSWCNHRAQIQGSHCLASSGLDPPQT